MLNHAPITGFSPLLANWILTMNNILCIPFFVTLFHPSLLVTLQNSPTRLTDQILKERGATTTYH